VRYVDVATKDARRERRSAPGLLSEDGLHMSPAGYAIWIAELKPLLALRFQVALGDGRRTRLKFDSDPVLGVYRLMR
jgi:hypothetical protein